MYTVVVIDGRASYRLSIRRPSERFAAASTQSSATFRTPATSPNQIPGLVIEVIAVSVPPRSIFFLESAIFTYA